MAVHWKITFPTEAGRVPVRQPLLTVEMTDRFDVLILANGGGVAGQAGAIKLGIARALVEFNAELRGPLKKAGLLTRDPREHERKKYGQKGAASGSSSPSGKGLFVVSARPGRGFRTCAPNLCQFACSRLRANLALDRARRNERVVRFKEQVCLQFQ